MPLTIGAHTYQQCTERGPHKDYYEGSYLPTQAACPFQRKARVRWCRECLLAFIDDLLADASDINEATQRMRLRIY